MTTTTTTPALADLDRLIERGTSIAGWIDKFGAKADAVDVLQLVALARRAAQPVAPVDYTVDDSELARKIMVFLGQRTSGSMEPGADPLRDRLAEKIAEWRPAPSPQVAEGAELPKPWRDRVDLLGVRPSRRAIVALDYAEREIADLRDAIAASRRAAGGKVETLRARLEEITDTNIKNVAANLHLKKRVRELEAQLATPAPASAGQAAPAPIAKLLGEIESIADELEADATNYEGDFADTVKGCAEELRKIVAQPAEGAAAEQPSAQENSNA